MSRLLNLGEITLHIREDGPRDGPALVFSNALGTDLSLWNAVLPHLPEGLRLIRYDTRGHGQSSVPAPPYSMGALVRDAERMLEALEVRECVFVGLSIGGMIAQGLAAKRLDLVRAVVLSNTAPKIGTRAMWEDRVAQVATGGVAALAETTMARWFSPGFRNRGADLPWKQMMEATPKDGYMGCAAAIAGTDFLSSTSGLRLPSLVISGDRDGSTPPDLVRDLAGLIPGSRFALIRGAGHLPCVEQPEAYGTLLSDFLRQIGHLNTR